MLKRLLLCAALAASAQVLAQNAPAQFRGVYAGINMRPTEAMIQRLGAQYGSDKRLAIKEVLASPGSYTPPVLYALANTLAEDHAEQAIFWYHVGRLRAVYDALRCRDKTAAQAGMLELRKRLSRELTSNQFYRRDRLVALAQKAVDWDAANPRDYDQRWIALYGKVAATSDGSNAGEIFVPEAEWPAILQHVHEAHLKAVEAFAGEKVQ
ncbi:MAG TPA: hypothetical protein VIF38_15100 [Burkholderiales bacterium]